VGTSAPSQKDRIFPLGILLGIFLEEFLRQQLNTGTCTLPPADGGRGAATQRMPGTHGPFCPWIHPLGDKESFFLVGHYWYASPLSSHSLKLSAASPLSPRRHGFPQGAGRPVALPHVLPAAPHAVGPHASPAKAVRRVRRVRTVPHRAVGATPHPQSHPTRQAHRVHQGPRAAEPLVVAVRHPFPLRR
jgi:hypothetical protein